MLRVELCRGGPSHVNSGLCFLTPAQQPRRVGLNLLNLVIPSSHRERQKLELSGLLEIEDEIASKALLEYDRVIVNNSIVNKTR